MSIFANTSKKIKEVFYSFIEKSGYKYPQYMISI